LTPIATPLLALVVAVAPEPMATDALPSAVESASVPSPALVWTNLMPSPLLMLLTVLVRSLT
jgi:hypothetical protein